jgi:hypothetical protein
MFGFGPVAREYPLKYPMVYPGSIATYRSLLVVSIADARRTIATGGPALIYGPTEFLTRCGNSQSGYMIVIVIRCVSEQNCGRTSFPLDLVVLHQLQSIQCERRSAAPNCCSISSWMNAACLQHCTMLPPRDSPDNLI